MSGIRFSSAAFRRRQFAWFDDVRASTDEFLMDKDKDSPVCTSGSWHSAALNCAVASALKEAILAEVYRGDIHFHSVIFLAIVQLPQLRLTLRRSMIFGARVRGCRGRQQHPRVQLQ
jgi:hypothetical protein